MDSARRGSVARPSGSGLTEACGAVDAAGRRTASGPAEDRRGVEFAAGGQRARHVADDAGRVTGRRALGHTTEHARGITERTLHPVCDGRGGGTADGRRHHGVANLVEVQAVSVTLGVLKTLDEQFLAEADRDLLQRLLAHLPEELLHGGPRQRLTEFPDDLSEQLRDDGADGCDRQALGNRDPRQGRAPRGRRRGEGVRDLRSGDRQRRDDLQLRVLDLGAAVRGEVAERRHRLGEFIHRVVAVEEHGELLVRGVRRLAHEDRHRFLANAIQVGDEVREVGRRRSPVVADAEHGGLVTLRPLRAGEIGDPLQIGGDLDAHYYSQPSTSGSAELRWLGLILLLQRVGGGA